MLIENLVPWRARPNFRLDALSAVLSGLYVGGIFPFVLFVARDRLHGSGFDLGLMTAAPFVGNLLALPLSHYLGRGNPVRAVAMTLGAARMIMVAASFVHGSSAFAWVVFAVQCLAAIQSPTFAAVVRTIYPLNWIGRLLSYSRVMLAAGMILSTVIAGALMEHINYRWVFLGLAPVGMAAMVIYDRIRLPGQPVRHEGNVVDYVGQAVTLLAEDKAFRWFAFAVFVYGFGNLMSIPVCTMYQVDVLHISSAQIAILNITTQVVWLVSYVLWGRIIDQVSPLKIVLANTILGVVLPLNHVLATRVWMLLPMAVVNGVVAAGIELSYFNSVMYFSTPANSALYQGMHSLLLGLRGCIAPFVGAGMAQWLSSAGYDIRWAFGAGIVLVIAGSWLQWYGLRHPMRGEGAVMSGSGG